MRPLGLTPELRRRLDQDYGSVDTAVYEAVYRAAEVRTLWDTYNHAWLWPTPLDFWEEFWRIALPVLRIDVAGEPSPIEGEPPRSRRKAIPRATLEKAVKLLKQDTSRDKTHRVTGLSTRLVDGLIKDLDANTGLDWNERDRLVLPPGTRTTPDGIVLPERR